MALADFCGLYERLDRAPAQRQKLALLVGYFAAVDAADAAWALHCLLGAQRRRLITGRRLREICLRGTGLPEWLFGDCHAHVGDSAETIALLWPAHGASPIAGGPALAEGAAAPLHVWMERILPDLAALQGPEQERAVQALWSELTGNELLVVNKLLTGGFRIGVGPALVRAALAQLSGLEDGQLQQRLMGGFRPSADSFTALLAAGDVAEADRSRPYPFQLAVPLNPAADPAGAEPPLPGAAADWQVEWKWDGVRGQLIHRSGGSCLWSRGEERLDEGFPELISAADALPDGTVLDGEVLVWEAGQERPAAFSRLQRRLGRRSPARSLLRQEPAVFVAYDLLESDGQDRRALPLAERRQGLELLLAAAAVPQLRCSPTLTLGSWEGLEAWRRQARSVGAEGLMLKNLAAPYSGGRRRGPWWKHKLDPLVLDAVLLYAQAGSGRRANLYTDYTFGLWERPAQGAAGEGQDGPRLVSFAKAYSGLNDVEISELDRWIRRHTTERFGPVRAVEPLQVFELAFEGLQPSSRHRSGLAVRFPRILRWRRDKPAEEADTLASAQALLASLSPC